MPATGALDLDPAVDFADQLPVELLPGPPRVGKSPPDTLGAVRAIDLVCRVEADEDALTHMPPNAAVDFGALLGPPKLGKLSALVEASAAVIGALLCPAHCGIAAAPVECAALPPVRPAAALNDGPSKRSWGGCGWGDDAPELSCSSTVGALCPRPPARLRSLPYAKDWRLILPDAECVAAMWASSSCLVKNMAVLLALHSGSEQRK